MHNQINRNPDNAVSPIIATILIVAITVVLAATLYAVIGGYGGLIGTPTPTAGMEVTESGGTYTVSITSVSATIPLSNIHLRIVYSSADTIQTGNLNYSGKGYITHISGPGPLSPLDTITISPATSNPGAIVSITLIDTSTSGKIVTWNNPNPVSVI